MNYKTTPKKKTTGRVFQFVFQPRVRTTGHITCADLDTPTSNSSSSSSTTDSTESEAILLLPLPPRLFPLTSRSSLSPQRVPSATNSHPTGL